MTKLPSMCMIALLVFFTLTCAARPEPAFKGTAQDLEADKMDNCDGVVEEECLMRRTLTAHLDYIYTQKQDKP